MILSIAMIQVPSAVVEIDVVHCTYYVVVIANIFCDKIKIEVQYV